MDEQMQNKSPQGLKRIIKAGKYSCQGLKAAFKNEAAFREEVLLSIVMIPAAFWFDVSQVERMLMVCTILLVLLVELLNSAIEAVVDRIGPEHHQLAGRAKDMGSAAVLIAMILCGYVWAEALFF